MERVTGQVVRCMRDVGGVKVVGGHCGATWGNIVGMAA